MRLSIHSLWASTSPRVTLFAALGTASTRHVMVLIVTACPIPGGFRVGSGDAVGDRRDSAPAPAPPGIGSSISLFGCSFLRVFEENTVQVAHKHADFLAEIRSVRLVAQVFPHFAVQLDDAVCPLVVLDLGFQLLVALLEFAEQFNAAFAPAAPSGRSRLRLRVLSDSQSCATRRRVRARFPRLTF